MPLTADTILSHLEGLSRPRRLLIGYSGGLDSHVLLHLCASIPSSYGIDLLAIHVNHGLQEAAADWGKHCQQVCAMLDVACRQVNLDLKPAKGRSLEAEAREWRYAAIQAEMQTGDLLLTAHHQDDQAETLLLQLLRGSGVHGLAAMPARIAFGTGYLCRPLLNHSRRELEDYARQQHLSWVDDPSNFNTDFDRNFLRQRVMPLLRERWPALGETVSRSAGHCAEASGLIDDIAADDLTDVLIPETNILRLSALQKLDEVRIRALLRRWIRQSGFRVPNSRRLQEIINQMLTAGDKSPLIAWEGAEVRRYRDQLYIMPPLPISDETLASLSLHWSGEGRLELPVGLGSISFERSMGGISEVHLANRTLTVAFNVDGLSYCPAKGSHRRTLKNFFQQQGIPPWERKRIPMLFADDELVAVGDLLVNAPYIAELSEPGIQLRWVKIP